MIFLLLSNPTNKYTSKLKIMIRVKEEERERKAEGRKYNDIDFIFEHISQLETKRFLGW